MLPYRDSRLTLLAIGVFFVLALGYGYFELQGMIYGPSIAIQSGTTVVHDQFVTISGTAARISSLSMNGKEITVTENGAFSEPYLLTPGVNRIVLDAKDRYGRKTERVITLVYVPTAAAPAVGTSSATTSASSTASSTAP